MKIDQIVIRSPTLMPLPKPPSSNWACRPFRIEEGGERGAPEQVDHVNPCAPAISPKLRCSELAAHCVK